MNTLATRLLTAGALLTLAGCSAAVAESPDGAIAAGASGSQAVTEYVPSATLCRSISAFEAHRAFLEDVEAAGGTGGLSPLRQSQLAIDLGNAAQVVLDEDQQQGFDFQQPLSDALSAAADTGFISAQGAGVALEVLDSRLEACAQAPTEDQGVEAVVSIDGEDDLRAVVRQMDLITQRISDETVSREDYAELAVLLKAFASYGAPVGVSSGALDSLEGEAAKLGDDFEIGPSVAQVRFAVLSSSMRDVLEDINSATGSDWMLASA